MPSAGHSLYPPSPATNPCVLTDYSCPLIRQGGVQVVITLREQLFLVHAHIPPVLKCLRQSLIPDSQTDLLASTYFVQSSLSSPENQTPA